MAPSIAAAIPIIEELALTLDKAYWEASSIDSKDFIYDCISAINTESSELNKLSVQDHDLSYEPISYEFRSISRRLTTFRKYLDEHIMRTSTLEKLEHAISAIIRLVNKDPSHMEPL